MNFDTVTNMKTFFSVFFGFLLLLHSEQVCSQQISSEILYKIQSPSGLVLDNEESFEDNMPLKLSQDKPHDKGQLWKITLLTNGKYTITNPYTDKNVDNGNIHDGEGNPIIQWMAEPSNKNQQWILQVTGTGAVQIKSGTNGMSLAVPQEEKEGAVVYQMPNSLQVWRLVASETVLPKDFVLRGEEDWQNETVFATNKMKGHTTFIPYASTKQLLKDAYTKKPWLESTSDLYLSLNGLWKFNWTNKPENRPKDFYQPGYNVSSWKELAVPACWESNGYGTMIYTNITYPFANRPPFIQAKKGFTNEEETNPVGSYRRTFEIPKHWNGQEVILHFDGVYSGFYVWVNGKKIGYSEGANNVSEFNITSALKKGQNTLAVEVYKWTDGSYLEDQDMFRFGGIHRDVFLYALPKTHIIDYHVNTDFADQDFSSADLKVEIAVRDVGTKEKGSFQIDASLLDNDLKTVANWNKAFSLGQSDSLLLNLSTVVEQPKLWSAEDPNLYTLVLALKDHKGKETQVVSSKVGFRKIEVKNKRVYVNGKQVFFKGVNRHDTHPEFGKTIPVASMLEDVLMMKQHNINTLRTSHYPNHPKMYAILDYYGLYTMDEADIENHGNHSLSDKESWRAAYIDRMERMILRDRNHPSVIFWSMGNESGGGRNFEYVHTHAKKLDPSRPIHYEGKNEAADIDSHMYPSLENMERFDQRDSEKPYFLCEYAHAMGNSLGNLYAYWDYIENRSQRMIGACIWDWADQAHVKKGFPKDQYFYGGQFGESPTDGDFSVNGLTTPDRRVTAKLLEVKKVYQYVKFQPYALHANKIKIANTYDFTNLNQFYLKWVVTKEGKKVQQGTIEELDLDADTDTIIRIPFERSFEPGTEYHLNVYLQLKEDNHFAHKGDTFASEQFGLTDRSTVPVVASGAVPALSVSSKDGWDILQGESFSAAFDKINGDLKSLVYNGKEVLHEGSGLNFNWYRSVNNDKYTDQAYHPTTINIESVDAYFEQDQKVYTLTKNAVAVIKSEREIRVPFTVKYTVYGDGKIDVESFFTKPPQADIVRRLGLRMALAPQYENVRYFGHGPHENYTDRIKSAFIGQYATTAKEMEQEHYVRAQSLGNREDARWLTLTDTTGKGIRILAKNTLSFSALHFTDEAVWNAKNDFNLAHIRQPQIYLCLDAVQQGLGNASCGPLPLASYMIRVAIPVFYAFRIEPVNE